MKAISNLFSSAAEKSEDFKKNFLNVLWYMERLDGQSNIYTFTDKSELEAVIKLDYKKGSCKYTLTAEKSKNVFGMEKTQPNVVVRDETGIKLGEFQIKRFSWGSVHAPISIYARGDNRPARALFKCMVDDAMKKLSIAVQPTEQKQPKHF